MSKRESSATHHGALRRDPFLILATSHWLSLFGLGLIVTALCTWIFLLPLQMRGEADNPYLGLIAFLAVPLILFSGLALVPIGVFLARRRVRRSLEGLADKRTVRSRLLVTFGVATLVNLAVGTQVTYRAVHHMETTQFCGSCHVMDPQAAAHRASPHERIACAECHIGGGASGWVRSKLNGSRQFFENLSGDFPRPVPSALSTDRLIPAEQTCEECHSRSAPGKELVRVISSFADDEENTLSQTVLTLHVGGRVLGGIHGAHANETTEIRFASRDAQRQDVVWIEARDLQSGTTRTWWKSGFAHEELASLRPITMECVDCHNRIGHDFPSPERGIDEALATGRLPTTLPFLKQQALALVQADYATQEEAEQQLPAALERYYRENHPEQAEQRSAEIRAAAEELARIRGRSVFPDLGVTWGTYPSNIGHGDAPGCFRCHGGEHATEEGKKLTNNCLVCHFTAAIDESEPEILQSLGMERVYAKARRE